MLLNAQTAGNLSDSGRVRLLYRELEWRIDIVVCRRSLPRGSEAVGLGIKARDSFAGALFSH